MKCVVTTAEPNHLRAPSHLKDIAGGRGSSLEILNNQYVMPRKLSWGRYSVGKMNPSGTQAIATWSTAFWRHGATHPMYSISQSVIWTSSLLRCLNIQIFTRPLCHGLSSLTALANLDAAIAPGQGAAQKQAQQMLPFETAKGQGHRSRNSNGTHVLER